MLQDTAGIPVFQACLRPEAEREPRVGALSIYTGMYRNPTRHSFPKILCYLFTVHIGLFS